jgi:hypothetical protein
LRRDKRFERGNLRHLGAHRVFAAPGFLRLSRKATTPK